MAGSPYLAQALAAMQQAPAAPAAQSPLFQVMMQRRMAQSSAGQSMAPQVAGLQHTDGKIQMQTPYLQNLNAMTGAF